MLKYSENMGAYEKVRDRRRRLGEVRLPALNNWTQLEYVANVLTNEFNVSIVWPNAYFSKKYTVYANMLLDVAPHIVAATGLTANDLAELVQRIIGGCVLCDSFLAVYPPSAPPSPPGLPLPPSLPPMCRGGLN